MIPQYCTSSNNPTASPSSRHISRSRIEFKIIHFIYLIFFLILIFLIELKWPIDPVQHPKSQEALELDTRGQRNIPGGWFIRFHIEIVNVAVELTPPPPFDMQIILFPFDLMLTFIDLVCLCNCVSASENNCVVPYTCHLISSNISSIFLNFYCIFLSNFSISVQIGDP